ncbi:GPI mannosyltransferase 2 [Aplysia californica]|uniref:GPI mannosyltransferase 2 n=1 Tax=Aplysia californica TaxID=6500 RepID=A0ABM0JVL0_APLCA|nr:GPI mannosyltransferase 2 [Aplysia californica]
MEVSSRQIVTFAFASRSLVLLLQFLANLLLPDHDADVFLPPVDKREFSVLDHAVHFLFSGLMRWDAVYFSHIAHYGYTYENCVAFFPFFPITVSSVAHVLSYLGVLHLSSWILLAAVITNFILFILAALSFFHVGKHALGDPQVSFFATILFCFNPASIFMSAAYSETLYFFLLVHALLAVNAKAFYAASFLIGLSVLTRSNGLVGIGFVLHSLGNSFFKELSSIHWCGKKLTYSQIVPFYISCIVKTIFRVVLCSIICSAAFFAYQFFIYTQFCTRKGSVFVPEHLISYGRARGYNIVGDSPSPWCNDTFPMSYTNIQKHHWGVGFMNYYEVKQIPNFILAFPVILLSVRSCLFFVRKSGKSFFQLGFGNSLNYFMRNTSQARDKKRDSLSDDEVDMDEIDAKSQVWKPSTAEHSHRIVVYIFHLIGLTVFGCCFVHIQVLTRLLFSSSPLLYWYCGMLWYRDRASQMPSPRRRTQSHPKVLNSSSWMDVATHKIRSTIVKCQCSPLLDILENWANLSLEFQLVVIYFVFYFIVGTVMFSNFLPWT